MFGLWPEKSPLIAGFFYGYFGLQPLQVLRE
jgi:hypothetical protein